MSEEFGNYGTPQYQEPPKNNGGGEWMATVSLILGIASIVLCCFRWGIGLVCGIAGIILAIIYNKNNGRNGLSTAGLVCSIIGIVLAIAVLVIGALGLAALGGLSALEGYM